jgi:small-conductance mechanosensitive channel
MSNGSRRFGEALAAPILLLIFCTLVVGLRGTSAFGQDEPIAAAEQQAAESRSMLDRIVSEIGAPSLTPQILNDKRAALDATKSATLSILPRLKTAIAELETRRRQLGPPPAQGAAEPETLVAERRALSDLLGRYSAAEKQLTLLAIEADQLSARIARLQRDVFLQRIFESSRSILNPRLWTDGAQAWSLVFERVNALISAWYVEAREKVSPPGLSVVLLAIGGLFVVGIILAGVLARKFEPAIRAETPTNFHRLWRPLWLLVITLLVFAFVMLVMLAMLEVTGIATPRFREFITAGFNFFVNFIVLTTFGHAILSPNWSQWRLPPLDDLSARRLNQLMIAGAFVLALDELSLSFVQLLFLPFVFSVGQSAILTVAMIVILAASLFVLQANRSGEAAESQKSRNRRFYFTWVARWRQVVWVLIAISGLALMFGYVALGHFIVFQIVNTFLLVFIFYILHHLVDEIVATSTQPGSVVGSFLRRKLVFGAGADLAIILIGVPIIFLQWTINWIDFHGWISRAWLGFEFAGAKIYPSTLVFALLVLLLGIVVTNVITRWIDMRVLMRTHLDKGVRESVRKGVSYTGILLACVIALTSAGVEFSSIAIIAGALGVGIGFGLQSIVNNFVSGLILLAERPVKVGDWIIVGAGEGIVKRINVRSTEIDTFDRATIIVPNSSLISEPVMNRTHGDTTGKGVIDVVVRTESDPEQVRDILLHCAQSHAGVAREPAPMVQLAGFSEFGLKFQLHFFVDDSLTAVPTASDLRIAIVKTFRSRGVELALGLPDLLAPATSRAERSRKKPT